MQERLRVVPRPPKGASITLAQAKKAWLKVERESDSKTGQSAGKDSGAKPAKQASSTKKKP